MVMLCTDMQNESLDADLFLESNGVFLHCEVSVYLGFEEYLPRTLMKCGSISNQQEIIVINTD